MREKYQKREKIERERERENLNLTDFILFHWLYFFYCMPEFVIVGTFPKLNNHIK